MNPTVTNAVAKLNEQRQTNVEAEAMILIGRIQNEQAAVKAHEARIAIYRTELDKVRHDVIDQTTVLGAPMTGAANPNEVTIARAITRLNDDRQKGVESQAISLATCIEREQDAIKEANDRISELRTKLTGLRADAVDETIVTG